jgi:hypothetical protein
MTDGWQKSMRLTRREFYVDWRTGPRFELRASCIIGPASSMIQVPRRSSLNMGLVQKIVERCRLLESKGAGIPQHRYSSHMGGGRSRDICPRKRDWYGERGSLG